MLKIGQRVEIDHPFYGQRTVMVLDIDQPMRPGQKTCYDCMIDGDKTWFDEDMILGGAK